MMAKMPNLSLLMLLLQKSSKIKSKINDSRSMIPGKVPWDGSITNQVFKEHLF